MHKCVIKGETPVWDRGAFVRAKHTDHQLVRQGWLKAREGLGWREEPEQRSRIDVQVGDMLF